MEFAVRHATTADEEAIFLLYERVAVQGGGIAREADEITREYVRHNLQNALRTGACFVIENPHDVNSLVAEIHTYKLTPRVFDHVLSELTIVVDPDFQGHGLGKLIFTALLDHIKTTRTEILRVELIARESNAKAIEFYKRLGFAVEGKFLNRIASKGGGFEADIPMAWINPSYKL